MKEKSPKVKCIFCKQEYTPNGLSRHFLACQQKKLKDNAIINTKGNDMVFLVKVSSYDPEYWLILEADSSATLKRLDSFLRNIWLECCGHLSRFEIEGQSYDSNTTPYCGEKLRGMNVQLGKALANGLQFGHEYDFGSTTYLKLKVIDERVGKLAPKPIRLLARNPEPAYDCARCKRKASLICSQCGDVCCESCAGEHECGEDMFSPLVNSPRTGVCGYVG